MSTHNPNKKKRTTMLLPEMGESAKRASHNALLRLFRHLSGSVPTSSAHPSETERKLVVTGFILSVLSILTSILPVCGLLTSICGLSIGIYSRQKSRALHTMVSWTIALALLGLVLSLLLIFVRIRG